MTDLRTRFFDFQQGADLVMELELLGGDDGLTTAVLLSLFTDRRARPDDTLPNADQGDDDHRGWWGDEYGDAAADEIGSRLWLNQSAKQMAVVHQRDKQYAQEALQWLLDDGIASRVNVTAYAPRPGMRAITVEIHRPDAGPARYEFENFWGAANGI